MKSLVLIMLVALVGCSSSNDDNIPKNNDELTGKWKLKKYQEWLSEPYNYASDEIIWEFDGNGTLTVTVDSQAVVHPDMYLQTSGNYTYSTIIGSAGHELLQISTILDTLGYEFVQGNELNIGYSHTSDEHSYWFEFEKIP